jgi:hypothetical protein
MVEEYAAMDKAIPLPITGPIVGTRDVLTDVPRDGARGSGIGKVSATPDRFAAIRAALGLAGRPDRGFSIR